ncbi:MAG: sodium-translocating pyrophosphatase [Lentimicrobiaceae bacterium]|jgi:K(+)-stimulated pyrophosphate-energized sodium pump|nr:sodium-translocating pyrophosphatase [Lentimicrobiaceae bacterium]MBT3453493.1 sodium-translocating pyrophosphatase [Lentimicrobiaceae bacterium]MBT3818260.1 sodium-translocating pyrophosphatase [Lentimicrobiaceae bacterium]MBT5163133.1 sodium-translocating pyrophosphatase [Lentimicrobiaceae bacterium]MBT5668197.1 sodium-translocating pyrophosphatase [Lentimicrobiaceae bacterium]
MKKVLTLFALIAAPFMVSASEADLVIPDGVKDQSILYWGFLVTFVGFLFGFYQFAQVKKIKAHKSMLDVAQVIFETSKTYLIQQGRFLAILFVFIGAAVAFYFGWLSDANFGIGGVAMILGWTVIGILGSYSVAWFGIRMNTLANSRMAFASLERKPIKLLNIPLNAGMSIGVVLISLELIMMLMILLFVPGEYAGASFIGFAIGESLGASVLRIAGGIFTKIADIGSDLMKVIFKIGEDDPRNPGTIADCVGDNAGDSVGPTADGFETYGVTGVALISFILLALPNTMLGEANKVILLTWIFVMRILMIATSIISFWINGAITKVKYENADDLDFEKPLTSLVWITSILSIIVTFIVSYLTISDLPNNLWISLSVIISAGTLGAALIPEFTKLFTSPKSIHVDEVVEASKKGGASLNILSGLVAGNFSAFWKGMVFFMLMFVAYYASTFGLDAFMIYPSIFAFGLVAFGMLGMGPVTIAVDSYGPVTDNAQSIYELSLIEENREETVAEIEKDFGFTPDFEKSKYYLEANDGAGNTFKATAKPVLIGTAVVGATTMIFALILVIKKTLGVEPEEILNLLNPFTIMGFLLGGSVIYWFTGASTQAVTTGAARAVEYIKKNINLDPNAPMKADVGKSRDVVQICTIYAQKGMWNIFIAIFSFALAFAFLSAPTETSNAPVAMFVAYLLSIAFFGLFQAIFMANAGGSWDNAKKVVEVDMKEKGTPLHDASVVGDTVGDPFKDTSSVALNPVIKFTTLFGLLAMEIAIAPQFRAIAPYIGVAFLVVALYFVWRSFYKMRINH